MHGLIGESGSGKTQTAFAIMRLLPPGGRIVGGAIVFEGADLAAAPSRQMTKLRGAKIAYIPQEPMSNLDPTFTIGSQLAEPMRVVLGIGRAEAKERALELLARVGIPDPERTFNAYPHQISGGMAQRVLIAGAISCNPDLLIADEPTTALDVTVQAEVLDLLRDLEAEFHMAILLVTHNFGVVADLCDRSRSCRTAGSSRPAPVRAIFADPRHPYTRSLFDAILEDSDPRGPRHAPRELHSMSERLLDVDDVEVEYHGHGFRGQPFQALKGVSLDILPGETVGLVGESGSGKTTLGRAVLGLAPVTGGAIRYSGRDISHLSRAQRRALASDIQVVFQDPYTSLNPALTIEQILTEPLTVRKVAKAEAAKRVRELLDQVHLPSDAGRRLPREFSGGQRQRIAIARALALAPRLIVCDEPVSALDLSTQARVLALFKEIQDSTGVAYLFISHDLAVVRHLSHRVAVMYRGEIVEWGDGDQVTAHPQHPYTQKLFLAAPVPDPVAQEERRTERRRLQAALN